jgi:nucleotide-binding universal stress UspA family protein
MTQTILVPIDLAEETSWTTTLPVAFGQAQTSGATVHVMTVVPDILAGLDWRYAIRGELQGSSDFDMRRIVADAEARVEEIVREHLPAGMKVATLARHGTIYDEILNVAEEIGADQIIMAAQSPSVSEYLLGTNAAKVVRHARCSVNVIRST